MLFFALLLGGALGWEPTLCGGPGTTTSQITQWGKAVDPKHLLPEYPRPTLTRSGPWTNLNGLWEFQPATPSTPPPFGKTLNSTILVPFPVESCLSGIGKNYQHLWYRLLFDRPAGVVGVGGKGEDRLQLNFGAVDWQTSVYVNSHLVGNHTGGYDGFSFDITEAGLKPTDNELFIYVFDPSDHGSQPNGKQRITAIDHPGGDTYSPSSGIWQTVWLEATPAVYVSGLKIVPDMKGVTVTVKAISTTTTTTKSTAPTATLQLLSGTTVVAHQSAPAGLPIRLDVTNPNLWAPGNPFLYTLKISLEGGDEVESYVGLRQTGKAEVSQPPTPPSGPQVGIDRPGGDMHGYPITLPTADPNLCWAKCNTTKGCVAWAYDIAGCDGPGKKCWLKEKVTPAIHQKCRISGTQGNPGGKVMRPTLNGKFVFGVGWLDQGWWPDGQYTAPSDEALASDLTAVHTFGMNLVRKHQKVESERWYYWADKLGILVWQDMIQKYGGATAATIPYFMSDLNAMIDGRFNHPSIVQWEVFNERDCVGVFKNVSDMVKYVQEKDPTRLVDTNSGGPANNLHIGDVDDHHTYPWPGNFQPAAHQFAALGEFGGIGAFVKGKEWSPGKCHTYLHVDTPADEASTYIKMAGQIQNYTALSATMYTQISDVELECDGFLNYDRTNKFNQEETQSIANANRKLGERVGK